MQTGTRMSEPTTRNRTSTLTARAPLIVRAKVRRSACGEVYVRTKPAHADPNDPPERVFVTPGASMLFWRDRTYRLVW